MLRSDCGLSISLGNPIIIDWAISCLNRRFLSSDSFSFWESEPLWGWIVQNEIVEKVWKIVDCRDQSLNAVHESQATQAVLKEREIDKMALSLVEKEREIVKLASALSDREGNILRKEDDILRKDAER